MSELTVRSFLEINRDRLQLGCAAGMEGLERPLKEKGISRPGLALTGFMDKFASRKIQVCGEAEVAYIRSLRGKIGPVIKKLASPDIPCFLVTNRRRLPKSFSRAMGKAGIPVLTSGLSTEQLSYRLNMFLDEKFAARTVVHGSLVDVYGVGMLLAGKSGIGKSEIALELLERGHRLIGDDVVTVSCKSEGILTGAGSELLKHYLELRGVGIVDVRSIFGLKAVRQEKRLEVEVRLERWSRRKNYERLGLETKDTTILGVRIPLIVLPVFPGKSIAVILEVIALNHILYQNYGYRPAEKLNERLINLMGRKNRARPE